MDNNLKTYLENQIQEYRKESENRKALYGDMMERIEECKSHIKSLKAKEDVGFSLLSPIAVDSAYSQQVDRLKDQMEMFEKQKEKYRKDILFYEGKIKEITAQLDEYEQNERLIPETAGKTEPDHGQQNNTTMSETGNKTPYKATESDSNGQFDAPDSGNKGVYDVKISDADISVNHNTFTNESEKEYHFSRQDIEHIVDKLSDIKGYINVDIVRCRLEIEQLEKNLREKLI